MNNLILSHCALSVCIAATLLASCGGSQQVASGTGALPQTAIAPTRGNAAHAEAISSGEDVSAAKREKLVYVSSASCWFFRCIPLVSVYKYSNGANLGEWTGTLDGGAYGECSDRAGNVFVGTTSPLIGAPPSAVLEFAHGGTKPIKVLSDPSGYPVECSVDPVSGNLAVIDGGSSTVAIYASASGNPTTYSDPKLTLAFVGYDGSGNLFVDGLTSLGTFGFAELPKGGNSFKAIKLNQVIGYPGPVQWDGKHMTVEDSSCCTIIIYRFAFSGRRGREVGSTPLLLSGPLVTPTWIFGSRVIAFSFGACTNYCDEFGEIFEYPGGGYQMRSRSGGVGVSGVTVSLPH